MATESPEFAQLRAARAHLQKSVASRSKVPNTSSEFQISTELEKKRILQIEERMGEIDAEAFKALQDAEAKIAKAKADAEAKAAADAQVALDKQNAETHA